MRVIRILVLLLVVVQRAWASSVEIPEGFGVNIHTHSSFPNTVEPLVDAGFSMVRTNLYWASIETERGRYNWRQYDELLEKLNRAGLRPLLVLSFSNPLYEYRVPIFSTLSRTFLTRVVPPSRPESRAAFAAFSAAAAVRYAKYKVILEVWNEPNYYIFWPPFADPEGYATLFNKTCHSVKNASPGTPVVGPSASRIPITDEEQAWWKTFLSLADLQCLDMISVHPYRENRPPETAASEYDVLRQLIQKYADRPIPIINSEVGYSSNTYDGVDERTQAAYVIRQYLFDLLTNVNITIWYDWINDGTDAKEKEHNFGIVANNGVGKAAFTAAKTFVNIFRGHRIMRRLGIERVGRSSDEADYILLMERDGKPRGIVAWSVSEDRLVRIELPRELQGVAQVVDMLGCNVPYKVDADSLLVKIGPWPVYAVGRSVSDREDAAEPKSLIPAASSSCK